MFGDFPVSQKIVVVTGGGSGISLECVRLAHSRGAKVLIGDIHLTKEAEDLVAGQDDVHFTKCDVRNWNELHALVQTSLRLWNDVPDVYIAGAGIFEPKWSSFWEDTEEDGYGSVAINVSHPIKLTRIAVRALLGKQKKGVVCIISSLAGLLGIYATPLYCATKHAIVGFVKSMASCDAMEGVKVTTICPCAVETPLWTNQPEKMVQFGLDKSDTASAAQVGDAILSLVEDGQYGGGTVLEITACGTRVIPEWNVSPPPTKLSDVVSQEAIDRNLAPIKKKLEADRIAFSIEAPLHG